MREKLRLAGAAQDIVHLVADQLADVIAGGGEILPGIEMIGMLEHVLTDGGGHGQAQVASRY